MLEFTSERIVDSSAPYLEIERNGCHQKARLLMFNVATTDMKYSIPYRLRIMLSMLGKIIRLSHKKELQAYSWVKMNATFSFKTLVTPYTL